VMKESISAAAAYVRSRAVAFGIEPPLFHKRDSHVHGQARTRSPWPQSPALQ
jgi:ATP-dependent Lon protease